MKINLYKAYNRLTVCVVDIRQRLLIVMKGEEVSQQENAA
jgi:hypothetical protein